MADIKFSSLSTAPSVSDMAYFTGVKDNGDGTFTNYNFTPAQMLNYVLANSKATITAASTGATITDAFFANPITEIVTDTLTYIINVHFTQNTGSTSITGIGGIAFSAGQILIAKK